MGAGSGHRETDCTNFSGALLLLYYRIQISFWRRIACSIEKATDDLSSISPLVIFADGIEVGLPRLIRLDYSALPTRTFTRPIISDYSAFSRIVPPTMHWRLFNFGNYESVNANPHKGRIPSLSLEHYHSLPIASLQAIPSSAMQLDMIAIVLCLTTK